MKPSVISAARVIAIPPVPSGPPGPPLQVALQIVEMYDSAFLWVGSPDQAQQRLGTMAMALGSRLDKEPLVTSIEGAGSGAMLEMAETLAMWLCKKTQKQWTVSFNVVDRQDDVIMKSLIGEVDKQLRGMQPET